MRFDQPIVEIKPRGAMATTLHICWMLHNQCNHKCSYCHEANYGGSHQWLKYDHVVRFFEQVFAHYGEFQTRFLVSLTGGEPTIWPDFLRLCEFLTERGCLIGMTTNGTRHPDFFEKSKRMFNYVAMSYHPEFTKDAVFLQNVKLLSGNTHLGVRVMMHKEKQFWDRSLNMVEQIKAIPDSPPIWVEYVPILDDFGTINPVPGKYAPWQQEFFAKNSDFYLWDRNRGDPSTIYNLPDRTLSDSDAIYQDGSVEELKPNDILQAELARFKGWSCKIGLDQLFINERGEVWRAGCQEGGKISHIFDEKIIFPKKPIVCTKNYCHCTTDITTAKWKTAHFGAAEA